MHSALRPSARRARNTERRLLSQAGQAELLIGKWLCSLLSVFTDSGHSSPADPKLRVTGTGRGCQVEHILRPLLKCSTSQTPGILAAPLCSAGPHPAHGLGFLRSHPFRPPGRRLSTPGGLPPEPVSFHLFRCRPTPPGSRSGIENNDHARSQCGRCPPNSPFVTCLRYGHSGQFSF